MTQAVLPPIRSCGTLALRIAERNEADAGSLSIPIELDECLDFLHAVYRAEREGHPAPEVRSFRLPNFLGAANLIRPTRGDRFVVTDDGVAVLSEARRLS